ncbi:MAG: HAMP domain-containing histidine kinase [Agathobacter sp.]|nr:HAMP domain-containing histidine kinase [Agathobacter sp.]
MKKYVQNFWVRFLAVVLCAVTLVTGIVSGLFIAGIAVGHEGEIYENVQEAVARNYAAYIYENVQEGEHQDIEKIENFLQKKNFTCSVTKISGGNVEADNKEEIELLNSLKDPSDWDYEYEIIYGAYVRYDVESVLDAIMVRPVIENYSYMTEATITKYAFDVETGLFYYYADDQYFLADYISVADDGTCYDYRIKNTENGNKVYYNSYYGITLDTSAYQQWDWVQLGEKRLSLAINGNDAGANEIRVDTDNTIQSKLYTGIYYENAEYHSISYYPERTEDMYIIRMNVKDFTQAGSYYKDMFFEWFLLWEAFYANEDSYQAVLVLSIILFILSFALLIYSAKDEKEKITFWNKIPVCCFTLGFGCIELALCGGLFFLIEYMGYGYNAFPFHLMVTLASLLVFGIAFLLFIWLQNIITRFKTKTFIRYSEVYYGAKVIKWCWSKVTSPFKTVISFARENTSLFMKGLVTMLVISMIEFFAIVICWWHVEIYLILFIIIKSIEMFLVICILSQMKKLQEGSKRIALGDLSEPIDTSKMVWEFKKHGENINKVSDGIALAVEERMKSERFKTELITNVSHDIKTPLTSIINYVDLIKKEDVQDETLQEYVDVLDRQSARLKKLIEDLMEASKASTGNLAVNMENCDVEVLLTQVIGEFEDKLSANHLEVVVQKPEHPVIVSADGRHMWRVLDNLLNNACKYSLPGSRVYVTLEENEKEAMIIFKNISKAPLNIPSDELMERFVRGDSSRNTEGSGLGLSIAQSLTELMQGSMKLEIDGDLFKVILKFNISAK